MLMENASRYGFLILLVMTAQSCISVGIGPSKAKKATGLTLVAPSPPFVEFESEVGDQVWRNPETGSTISYYSDCSRASDPNLDEIKFHLLGELDQGKVLEEKRVEYNQRAAIDALLSGSIDGILTQVHLIIFKKSGCIYTLTYASLPHHFAQNRPHFQSFAKEFRAP